MTQQNRTIYIWGSQIRKLEKDLTKTLKQSHEVTQVVRYSHITQVVRYSHDLSYYENCFCLKKENVAFWEQNAQLENQAKFSDHGKHFVKT